MREGAIVPEVTLVGEAVADETELALLDVLLDGVEVLPRRHLELRAGPLGDLADEVERAVLIVQRHVVPRRDGQLLASGILPHEEYAVVQGAGCPSGLHGDASDGDGGNLGFQELEASHVRLAALVSQVCTAVINVIDVDGVEAVPEPHEVLRRRGQQKLQLGG